MARVVSVVGFLLLAACEGAVSLVGGAEVSDEPPVLVEDGAGSPDPRLPLVGREGGAIDPCPTCRVGTPESVCGDGVVSGGELCEPPTCPTACDDGDACTSDALVGAACTARCVFTPLVGCGVQPACGNGACETGEACGTCAADCGACAPVCGNGTCEAGAGETCRACTSDCGACEASCGDGVCDVSEGEVCGTCGADCATRAVVCGNGECQTGEPGVCIVDCGGSPRPSEWVAFEAEALVRMNEVRATGYTCRGSWYGPAAPLTSNAALAVAAALHSVDMAASDFLSHTSCNGRVFTERAAAQGSSVRSETAAWNYRGGVEVVNGWLGSDSGHCEAVMNPAYREVGIGMAQAAGGPYWTAMYL